MSNPETRSIRATVAFMPLCMTFLATALVLQDAFTARASAIVDDGALSSIMLWIHPAAMVMLLAGYGISILSLILSIRDRD